MDKHTSTFATLLLVSLVACGCATSHRALTVDRTPTDGAIFPVVPFDLLYIYGTDHVIAFLDDHPRYDAVEVTLIDGGMPMFITTLKDMTQVDHMNSRSIVEQRNADKSMDRACEYAEIEFDKEMRDDGTVAVYSKAALASGEVVELDFVSEPQIIPWPRGTVMPTGGHSGESSIVAMNPARRGAAFAAASSRVLIDGEEVAVAPLQAGEDSFAGFGPGGGGQNMYFWLDGFDLRVLQTVDRRERVIETTSEDGQLQWVTVVNNGQTTKVYEHLGQQTIDGVVYEQIRQDASFNQTITSVRRVAGGLEIKQLEAITMSGNRTVLDFSPPVVVADQVPDGEVHESFSLFSLVDGDGYQLLRGRLWTDARSQGGEVVNHYRLSLTDPSYIAARAMQYEVTWSDPELHVVSELKGEIEDVVPDEVTPFEHLTWVDSFLLPKDRTVVFLPVGAIEEHGPHLPLATDAIGADELASATATHFKEARPHWAVLVAPLVPYGHADYGMDFSGNISIRAEVLREYIRDICESLARHGFRNVVVVGHQMEPKHLVAVQQAIEDVRTRYPVRIVSPTEAVLFGLVEAMDRGEGEGEGEGEGDGEGDGEEKPSFGHASVGETSMILHHHGELADERMLALLPEYDVGFPDNLMETPNFRQGGMELGYSGYPGMALDLQDEIGSGYFEGWGNAVADLAGDMVAGEQDVYDRARCFLVDIPMFQLEEGSFGGPSPDETAELREDDLPYIADQLQLVQDEYLGGNTSEALARTDTLVEQYPKSADCRAWRGMLMGALAGEVGGMEAARYGMEAGQEFELALYIDPENALAFMGLGMLKLFTPAEYGGSVEAAIENLDRALELSDDPDLDVQILGFLATSHENNGDPDRCRDCLERLLEIDPANADAAQRLKTISP